jgi:hypothetical protein
MVALKLASWLLGILLVFYILSVIAFLNLWATGPA